MQWNTHGATAWVVASPTHRPHDPSVADDASDEAAVDDEDDDDRIIAIVTKTPPSNFGAFLDCYSSSEPVLAVVEGDVHRAVAGLRHLRRDSTASVFCASNIQ
jgi:hypothetical protein